VGFEPTVPAFERAKTVHVLDSSATVTGLKLILHLIKTSMVQCIDVLYCKGVCRMYVELLQLHPNRRRETSSSVIPRLYPHERRSEKEGAQQAPKATLWEYVLSDKGMVRSDMSKPALIFFHCKSTHSKIHCQHFSC
jgi:hypothetical protein